LIAALAVASLGLLAFAAGTAGARAPRPYGFAPYVDVSGDPPPELGAIR